MQTWCDEFTVPWASIRQEWHEEKLTAVQNFPLPDTHKKLREFLGLVISIIDLLRTVLESYNLSIH